MMYDLRVLAVTTIETGIEVHTHVPVPFML